jgi:hypothetical protein
VAPRCGTWHSSQAAVHAAMDGTNFSDWVFVDVADLPSSVRALSATDLANLRGCEDKVAAGQLSCMVDGPDSVQCRKLNAATRPAVGSSQLSSSGPTGSHFLAADAAADGEIRYSTYATRYGGPPIAPPPPPAPAPPLPPLSPPPRPSHPVGGSTSAHATPHTHPSGSVLQDLRDTNFDLGKALLRRSELSTFLPFLPFVGVKTMMGGGQEHGHDPQYRSIGRTQPYVGDLAQPGELDKMLDARTFQNELIAVRLGQTPRISSGGGIHVMACTCGEPLS